MNDSKMIGHISKKQYLIAGLICAAGIALNLILNTLVSVSGLPVYLDCVGTISVSALGGYLPGVITGFITSIIKSIWDPSYLYYGLLNVMIAIAAAYIARRWRMFSLKSVFISIIAFTLIGGGIGSAISWFIEGFSPESGSLSGLIYETFHLSPVVSHVVSNLIIHLLDKTISVIAMIGILRIISARLSHAWGFDLWMQTRDSADELKNTAADKKNIRVISLRAKILLSIGASLVIVAVVVMVISITAYHRMIISDRTELAQLAALEKRYLVETISLYLSCFILICTFLMWLTEHQIIHPVQSITNNVKAFSYAGSSQIELDEDVRAFRNLDIHTGDELELLYHALCQLTLNQTEQMRSIRRLSDSTLKMQDGLIITMADMVENRDSDTGAHIQKTAAYVRIIAEGLMKKGYYAEKITPKFISDVVRSAPLHDVGKINIPDEVLNKPGKLTDEEFEIMKTHTTAGEQIIEHAISTVEGDSYLKEARNMAAFHHERWDGKGYPQKLHGEVIPLSARIMAVADVFDALTSPRVYKPAFPLDKALSIIAEGKGTQFDPKCVEVFMDSLDEVQVVLRKYNQDVV